MALVIESVLPSRFAWWARQRPFEVLFLGTGATVRRSSAAIRNFELLFPQQVGAGWMSRDTVPSDDWWTRHWVTELGPVRPLPPASGVWLFHLGYVAGHHPGAAHAQGDEGWEHVREYLVDRIKLKNAAGSDGTEWTRRGPSSSSSSSSSSSNRVVPARATEAYEVLEVAPAATDEEVKSAYRTALKLNHPDRVAHLSKQIQAFAQERTQLIVAAWQAIKSERGLR